MSDLSKPKYKKPTAADYTCVDLFFLSIRRDNPNATAETFAEKIDAALAKRDDEFRETYQNVGCHRIVKQVLADLEVERAADLLAFAAKYKKREAV